MHVLAAARRCLAAVALVATAGGACAGEVRHPHYGDALFHFYQAKHFTALASLMTSQHFERMPSHRDDAELLRGGLLLSYGLHREAGQIFAKLIEDGAAPAVRDRAWFFVAKIRWQRGMPGQAEASLARIGGALPAELEEERKLLHAQVLMTRGDHAGATAVLDGIGPGSDAVHYARYNLGIALVKAGDTTGGSARLDEVGRTPFASDELRTLRDQANVALGFAALQEQRPEAARSALERVRLQSLHSHKALLGFGWAAEALGQPQDALVPWSELASRDADDAAALEARIALPLAYAELGAQREALERYEDAIASFDRERGRLDASIAAIRAGHLVDALLDVNPHDGMGWLQSLERVPEMPHARHLAPLLAQHEFQEAFKNFRDLRFLSGNLEQWRASLGTFGDMLANRRQAYAERRPQVRAGAHAEARQLEPLQRRHDALAAEFARAEGNGDGRAFADARERDLLARLADVRTTLDRRVGEPGMDALRERARLAEGALAWQLAREVPGRTWNARKALARIAAELTDARSRDAAIAQAQRDEPARFDAFAARIARLDAKLGVLIPRVAALTGEQQIALQDIAVAEVTRQQERLAAYTEHAHFAVAQLYDRALLTSKEGDRAAPR